MKNVVVKGLIYNGAKIFYIVYMLVYLHVFNRSTECVS